MIELNLDQQDSLRREQVEAFVRDMVHHLTALDPFHAEAVGQDGLRTVAELGIGRAQTYGWTRKDPVRVFLEMMMVFGSYFSTDPSLNFVTPWTDPDVDSNMTQADRINKMRSGAHTHIKAVSGPGAAHIRGFLDTCRATLNAPLQNLNASQTADFVINAWPERAESMGRDTLGAFIKDARDIAKQAGLTPGTSGMLILWMKLTYGHKVEIDPLFPWLTRFLKRAPTLEKNDEALCKMMRKFLDAIHTHHAQTAA